MQCLDDLCNECPRELSNAGVIWTEKPEQHVRRCLTAKVLSADCTTIDDAETSRDEIAYMACFRDLSELAYRAHAHHHQENAF